LDIQKIIGSGTSKGITLKKYNRFLRFFMGKEGTFKPN
jgi:hypothetical protein